MPTIVCIFIQWQIWIGQRIWLVQVTLLSNWVKLTNYFRCFHLNNLGSHLWSLNLLRKLRTFTFCMHIGMETLILLMFVFSLLNNVKKQLFSFWQFVTLIFFKIPCPNMKGLKLIASSLNSVNNFRINNNILVASSFLKNSSSSTTSTAPPSLGYASILFNILFYLF